MKLGTGTHKKSDYTASFFLYRCRCYTFINMHIYIYGYGFIKYTWCKKV